MPFSKFALIIKSSGRFLQLVLFVVVFLLAHGLFAGRAQRRAERSKPETKPKSKIKTPPTSRSRAQQQQVNADGSITGELWVGQAGISETTADIMTREQSLRAKSKRRAERESEEEEEEQASDDEA